MHYISEQGSFTTLHEEDGGLSNINILKCGREKVWLIVDHHYQAKFEKKFKNYLSEKTKDESICDQMLKHKIYIVTPYLLSTWKILFTLVV